MNPEFWNERYSEPDYVYGTAPNDFIASVAGEFPPGPVLCLAEGEGRNAVFLARRGHPVTAVDQSAVGLAKARELATQQEVTITTIVADLATFVIEPEVWSGIISTFGHLPSALRRQVYAAAVHGLRPGGVFVLEAYTPAQLAYRTGGPADPDMLMTAAALRTELTGLEFPILRELVREVNEGAKHHGRGAVVQVLGRKPQRA